MATNNFKPFALANKANVTPQEDWEKTPALMTGFSSGKASSAQINKVLRQATFISAALAEFVSIKTNSDIFDDGDFSGFVTKLTEGLSAGYLSRQDPFADISADGNVQTALGNLGLGDIDLHPDKNIVRSVNKLNPDEEGHIGLYSFDDDLTGTGSVTALAKTDANQTKFILANADGTERASIYKDKNSDLHINNGAEGGGDFIIARDNIVSWGSKGSCLADDGNVHGKMWEGWLREWIDKQFNARDIRIDACATALYVKEALVMDIRLGAIESIKCWRGPGYRDQAPFVITGAVNNNNDEYIDIEYRRPLQKNVNNVWYNVRFE